VGDIGTGCAKELTWRHLIGWNYPAGHLDTSSLPLFASLQRSQPRQKQCWRLPKKPSGIGWLDWLCKPYPLKLPVRWKMQIISGKWNCTCPIILQVCMGNMEWQTPKILNWLQIKWQTYNGGLYLDRFNMLYGFGNREKRKLERGLPGKQLGGGLRSSKKTECHRGSTNSSLIGNHMK